MKKKNDLDRTTDIVDLIKKEKKDYDIDELLENNSPENVKFKESNLSNLEKKEKDPSEDSLRKLVEEKKEEELITKIKNTKENNKPSNKGFHLFLSFLFTMMILLSIAYIGYTFFKFDDSTEQTKMILNSGILFIMSFSLILMCIAKKVKWKRFFTCIGTLCLSAFFSLNILVDFNVLKLPENKVIPDFRNVSISEALKWAKENHIDVTQIYDNSDKIEEYNVIAQDVEPNTVLRDVSKITFTVSEGPDYNKEISIANMVGWNIDDAMEEIEENFLNNVFIDYEINEETIKDIVLSQSRDGQMKRSDELKLMISLGDGSDLKPVPLEDFSKQSLLKASVWLKRYGILYEIEYEFSETVSRGQVIRQSIKKGTTVTPNQDKVILTVSKGKKIVVPDLTKMSIGEATNWVISNKLKVRFEEKYHATVQKGYIIEANYKENDIVEEGTLIEITSSKGSLKMKKFDNINEFRSWANEHDIKIQEEYEQSKTVSKGSIIRFSVEDGVPVNTGDVITVYISTGSTVVIPNFVGKSKNNIESTCKELELNCTFTYGGTSSYDKDVAISQNKKANSEVIPDTYVNIVLSSGKASTSSSNNTNKSTPAPSQTPSSNNNTPTPIPTPKPKPTPTPTPICQKVTKEIGRDILNVFNNENNNTYAAMEKALYSYFSSNFPNVKVTVVGVEAGGSSGSYVGGIGPGTKLTSCNTDAYIIEIAK